MKKAKDILKRLALLILLALFVQTTVSSQPCLPEGIIFSTQEQIDNFQTNYPNCTEIEGDVNIAGDDITNLIGLSVLTFIGGSLSIGDWYHSNLNLTSLTGLEGLTSIGGYLSIESISLISLTGLDNVASIGESLKISRGSPPNIPSLTSLTGLEGLTSIGGFLEIGSINFLTNLTGLSNVTSIGGYLFLWDNDSLTSLTGLESLTSIGGRLLIGGDLPGGNNALTSLTGLDNLISIGDGVYIGANDALITLTGLDNVTSIGGQLYIYSNDALTSLTSLSNIDAGSITDLYLFNNPFLSSCEVQSICDYLASTNGEIEIHDNAPGCNNQEEVEEACDAITGIELNEAENYLICPNPVKDILTFSSSEITTIEIYDLMGALIARRNANKVDMSNLSPGIYFVIGFDKNSYPLYKGKIIKK